MTGPQTRDSEQCSIIDYLFPIYQGSRAAEMGRYRYGRWLEIKEPSIVRLPPTNRFATDSRGKRRRSSVESLTGCMHSI